MFHPISLLGSSGSSKTADPFHPACDYIIALVAREKRIHVQAIKHPSRSRANAAHARQLAMYLCHVMLGLSLSEVGAAFHRDRTTVSYACGAIEDMRDDPDFDRLVSSLEAQIAVAGSLIHD